MNIVQMTSITHVAEAGDTWSWKIIDPESGQLGIQQGPTTILPLGPRLSTSSGRISLKSGSLELTEADYFFMNAVAKAWSLAFGDCFDQQKRLAILSIVAAMRWTKPTKISNQMLCNTLHSLKPVQQGSFGVLHLRNGGTTPVFIVDPIRNAELSVITIENAIGSAFSHIIVPAGSVTPNCR